MKPVKSFDGSVSGLSFMETVFFPKNVIFIAIFPKSLRACSMVRGSCWCGISNTSFVKNAEVVKRGNNCFSKYKETCTC